MRLKLLPNRRQGTQSATADVGPPGARYVARMPQSLASGARIPYTACPLCALTELRQVRVDSCATHPLYDPRIPAEMRWMQCLGCWHIFTEGYFTPAACEVLFSRTNTNQQVGHDFERQRPVSARIVEKVLPWAQDGAWLDVGCGNGSLLFTAQEYGFSAVGTDLRAGNVETLKKCGIDGLCVDLLSLDAPETFRVISMADVLEHMPFPKAGLAHARTLLKPDGVVFLSMPNLDCIPWKLLDGQKQNPYWGELEHYHNFGRRRLYALLEETGFRPVRYGISERYRVCMEVIAQRM